MTSPLYHEWSVHYSGEYFWSDEARQHFVYFVRISQAGRANLQSVTKRAKLLTFKEIKFQFSASSPDPNSKSHPPASQGEEGKTDSAENPTGYVRQVISSICLLTDFDAVIQQYSMKTPDEDKCFILFQNKVASRATWDKSKRQAFVNI